MSTLSGCYDILVNGVGKCSKPMWDGHGMPAGFCDEPAYGRQTAEGKRRSGKYVPALACLHHGGPSRPTDGSVAQEMP